MSQPKPRSQAPERAAVIAELRGRVAATIDAFERAEPEAAHSWSLLRTELEKAHSLTALKAWAREVRGMSGALGPEARRALELTLFDRFGPDPEAAGDAAVVASVRARGRIRSEREYRAVQAFADAMPRDPDDATSEAAYLELGALLDAFMAGA